MATVVPDQSKWSTIFCITTQLSTARSIYLETWIWLYFKRSFNTHYLPLYRKLTLLLPFSEFVVPFNSSAGHNGPKLVLSTSLAHIFSQSLVSPLCAPQLQQWKLFIAILQPLDFCKYEPRNQKHGTLMLLLNRPLPKYYEKIPRTCLMAEVRHEMGSPFRYRYLPPTNRHIMQLYICEHDMGFKIMRWDRCIRNVWRFSFSLKR